MAKDDAVSALFRGSEFEYWATRDYIHSLEEHFIRRFFSPEHDVLEAGTGGGYLLHFMHNLGFKNLTGFDLLPEFINYARLNDTTGQLHFDCADATKLPYQDGQFSQLLYFSHMLSLLPDAASRDKTLQEAHRVLQPGGIALFNVLSYEFRQQKWTYRLYLSWLRMIRRFRSSHTPLQYLPMLKHKNRINPGAFSDKGPYFYWFRASEIIAYLQNFGFEVFCVAYRGSDKQPVEVDVENPKVIHATGHLYLACRKKLN